MLQPDHQAMQVSSCIAPVERLSKSIKHRPHIDAGTKSRQPTTYINKVKIKEHSQSDDEAKQGTSLYMIVGLSSLTLTSQQPLLTLRHFEHVPPGCRAAKRAVLAACIKFGGSCSCADASWLVLEHPHLACARHKALHRCIIVSDSHNCRLQSRIEACSILGFQTALVGVECNMGFQAAPSGNKRAAARQILSRMWLGAGLKS